MNATEPIPSLSKTMVSKNKRGSSSDLFAVLFAMTFPTLVTLVYFQWLAQSESSFQQAAFGLGKVIQFGFPLVWVWLWHRGKLCSCFDRQHERIPTLDATRPADETGSRLDKTLPQIGIGIGMGILVAIAMYVIYFLLLESTDVGIKLTGLVQEKVTGMKIDSFGKFLGLGIFYSLCHSFLEEYYWRWFVFDFLQKFTSTVIANVLSSLGFMAHHVVLLGFFFGWDSPLTYGLSLCIAVGGSVWAWQYKRTGSLLAPWISHMIVDAGIFSLGFFLVRSIL